MKCDELKEYKDYADIMSEWFMGRKFYVASDVDAVLSEKDKKIAELEAENAQLMKEMKFMHSNCGWHVGDGCARLLGEKLAIIDDNVKLKQKLEDVNELIKESKELLKESQKMHQRCADNASKKIRHHKYRRCLAMAEFCQYRSETFFTWSKKMGFLLKWHKRWLELAKTFKEAK